MPYCTNCGAKVGKKANFCPECGFNLITNSTQVSEIGENNNRANEMVEHPSSDSGETREYCGYLLVKDVKSGLWQVQAKGRGTELRPVGEILNDLCLDADERDFSGYDSYAEAHFRVDELEAVMFSPIWGLALAARGERLQPGNLISIVAGYVPIKSRHDIALWCFDTSGSLCILITSKGAYEQVDYLTTKYSKQYKEYTKIMAHVCMEVTAENPYFLPAIIPTRIGLQLKGLEAKLSRPHTLNSDVRNIVRSAFADMEFIDAEEGGLVLVELKRVYGKSDNGELFTRGPNGEKIEIFHTCLATEEPRQYSVEEIAAIKFEDITREITRNFQNRDTDIKNFPSLYESSIDNEDIHSLIYRIIEEEGHIKPELIAKKLGLSSIHITEPINRLMDLGYIKRDEKLSKTLWRGSTLSITKSHHQPFGKRIAEDFVAHKVRVISTEETPTKAALIKAKDHRTQALNHKLKDEWDDAIVDYTKAIELDSNFTLAYFERGQLYKLLGKKSEAIADFEKVVSLSNKPETDEAAQRYIEELQK